MVDRSRSDDLATVGLELDARIVRQAVDHRRGLRQGHVDVKAARPRPHAREVGEVDARVSGEACERVVSLVEVAGVHVHDQVGGAKPHAHVPAAAHVLDGLSHGHGSVRPPARAQRRLAYLATARVERLGVVQRYQLKSCARVC